jgi:hypothetical protein
MDCFVDESQWLFSHFHHEQGEATKMLLETHRKRYFFGRCFEPGGLQRKHTL